MNSQRDQHVNPEQTFRQIYNRNTWGSSESVSGPGSTVSYTAPLRAALTQFIYENNVESILDAPCGDYNWQRTIFPELNLDYTGIDIVPAIVHSNQQKHGGPSTRFQHQSICEPMTGTYDLWLCRDCLFHLSNKDTWQAIHNLSSLNLKYFAVTSHERFFTRFNRDINNGDFRLFNIRKPPFNFPAPIAKLVDYVRGFPRRYIYIYDVPRLLSSIDPIGVMK